jgi:Family of unknown function (DUF6236)
MEATRGIVFGTNVVRHHAIVNMHGPDWMLAIGGRNIGPGPYDAIGFHKPSTLLIRQYLTYWDKLAWTMSPEDYHDWRNLGRRDWTVNQYDRNSINNYYWMSSEGELLIDEGILTCVQASKLADPYVVLYDTPVTLGGWTGSVLPPDVVAPLVWPSHKLSGLMDWSIGQGGFEGKPLVDIKFLADLVVLNDPKLLANLRINHGNASGDLPSKSPLDILVTMLDVLPAPAMNVPIEKILAFRQERRAEILAFREAVTELTFTLTQAEKTQAAVARVRENIESALVDLHRVFNESKMSKIVCSVKTYLSLEDPALVTKVIWPALGAITAGSFHLPVAAGALAGISLNAGLTFAQRRNQNPLNNLPKSVSDYAYIYYVKEELT